jgi:hypothetical protein
MIGLPFCRSNGLGTPKYCADEQIFMPAWNSYDGGQEIDGKLFSKDILFLSSPPE